MLAIPNCPDPRLHVPLRYWYQTNVRGRLSGDIGHSGCHTLRVFISIMHMTRRRAADVGRGTGGGGGDGGGVEEARERGSEESGGCAGSLGVTFAFV
eukprot:365309-Chlamydomonas_euryale.AAC.9